MSFSIMNIKDFQYICPFVSSIIVSPTRKKYKEEASLLINSFKILNISPSIQLPCIVCGKTSSLLWLFLSLSKNVIILIRGF